MQKRRAGSELGHNSFGRYLKRCLVFVFGESACLGQYDENGRFWVSHFCPASTREGVAMLAEMRGSKHRIGFAVTSDMVGMLCKLGYTNLDVALDSDFRGVTVKKHLVIN